MSNIFKMEWKLVMVTLVGIIYVAVLFSISGLTATYILDNYLFGTTQTKFESESIENVSLIQILSRTAGTVAIVCLVAFMLTNLIQLIPFPFNGFEGYDITNTEQSFGHLMIIFMTVFSQTISREYKEIKYKLAGHVY